ncbi:methyltransferase [Candidatus Leptofilum sp.]|uniref:methyltransferase n=1 Tax=Candidatus Leptofilum sp. TaxID=3241576 RepID=UPI003B5BFC63
MKVPANYFFFGQFQHILLLACLLPGAIFLAFPSLDNSTWLGITDSTWFNSLLIIVIIHQFLGWFVFRSQLCFSLFSRIFGRYDLFVWGCLFFPFLLLRPLLTLALGLADAGSITEFRSLQIIVGLILLLPAFYTLWSLHKYFGMVRALGADHFREQYRQMPLVREGAFKYSSNAMYAFVFLIFWAIALLTGSLAALAAALFQHAYIWVHLYCTEEPDMRIIYGTTNI